MNIIERIAEKGSDKERIAEEAIKEPENIPLLIEGLISSKGSVRLGCEKAVRLISEKKPDLVYPYFDTFVTLLDSDNNFLKWGAIITIANLAAVDSGKKFEKIFEKYYSPVTGENMITAANIVGNSWKIASAKPELADRITGRILKAEKAEYINKGQPSPECTNVVCGHIIESLDKYYDNITDKKPVADFIKRQLDNTRKPVAKKAERFLKKHSVSS